MPVYSKKKNDVLKGDGVADVILKLLGNVLEKPAYEVGSILSEKIKKLTGRGASQDELNKLMKMIKIHQKKSAINGEGSTVAGKFEGEGSKVSGRIEGEGKLEVVRVPKKKRVLSTQETITGGPYIPLKGVTKKN